ncbi:TVP38/TMEM64 family protein [Nocardioides nanhaiensis]|uniref:TVP38/TMEM64 family membrane protein n=1 Tax=Nocardioides nanhaiensis TaxID=1476871 RepID=A0ABP8W9Z6_9ACTN
MTTSAAARSRPVALAVLLVAVLAAALVVQLVVGLPTPGEVQDWLQGLGGWVVPAYVAVYVGVCLLPAGPVAVLTLVGGAALGPWLGVPVTLAAAVVGASGAFALARLLGRDAVLRLVGDRARGLDELVERHGLTAVLLVRLVPFMPYAAASYAFGLSAVRWRNYVLGTAVGVLPSTAALVVVGAYGADPGSWPFLVAAGVLAALTVWALWRARRARGARTSRVSGSSAPTP